MSVFISLSVVFTIEQTIHHHHHHQNNNNNVISISLPYLFSLLDQQKNAVFRAYKKKRHAHLHKAKCNKIKIAGKRLLEVS
jgi:hypothetical protein